MWVYSETFIGVTSIDWISRGEKHLLPSCSIKKRLQSLSIKKKNVHACFITFDNILTTCTSASLVVAVYLSDSHRFVRVVFVGQRRSNTAGVPVTFSKVQSARGKKLIVTQMVNWKSIAAKWKMICNVGQGTLIFDAWNGLKKNKSRNTETGRICCMFIGILFFSSLTLLV